MKQKKITKFLIGAFALTMAVFQPASAFPDHSALNTVVTAEAAATTPGKIKLKSIKAIAHNKIQINWNKTSGATEYRIFYKKYGTNRWTFLRAVNTNVTSYTHISSAKNPIECGRKYTFTVRAYNSKTKRWGGYDTKGLTARTLPSTVKLKSIKTNSAKTSVTISWNKAYGGDYYRIYRKTPGTSWKLIDMVRYDYLSYTDRDPIENQKNIYTVRMCYTSMQVVGGYNTSGLSVTIPKISATSVGTPKLSGIKATAYNKITINWNKTANTTGYRIFYKIPGDAWKAIATVGANTTSYTHTSSSKYPIYCGVGYTYTVRAYNNKLKKWGDYDREGLHTYTQPSTVNLKKAILNDDGTVTVSWDRAYGGKYYEIFRKTSSYPAWRALELVSSSVLSYTDKNPVVGETNTYTVRVYNPVPYSVGDYNINGVSITPGVSLSEGVKERAKEIIKLTNEERAKEGIAPLQYDQKLTELAMFRATKDIDDVELYGIPNFWTISAYSMTPSELVDGWMKSVKRYEIMNPDYKYTGVGAYVTRDGKINWIQAFSKYPIGKTCTLTLKYNLSSLTLYKYMIAPWNSRIKQEDISGIYDTGYTLKGWTYKGKLFTDILVNQDMTLTGIVEKDDD